MQNIVLIGMPGSGKSTLGRVLAEKLNYHFIDTDNVIMNTYHHNLMELIEQHGNNGFIELEGKVLCSLHTRKTVISTGGSAVYNERAMQYLKQSSIIVYLYHPLPELTQRVGNLVTRGVVCHGGCTTLAELFAERCPLYERYADLTVNLSRCSVRACNQKLLQAVQNYLQKQDGE